MSNAQDLSEAAQQFINDMTAAGAPARADGPRILYDITPVGGALAGQLVTTGVSLTEVQSWPAIPPHWIHLPATVRFELTNTDSTDCAPGFMRHSREYNYTDTSIPPARAWLSHVGQKKTPPRLSRAGLFVRTPAKAAVRSAGDHQPGRQCRPP